MSGASPLHAGVAVALCHVVVLSILVPVSNLPRHLHKILQVLARRMRLEGTFDFEAVAAKTPGYVGADLSALTKEAGATAITRVFSTLRPPVMVRLFKHHLS